MIPLLWQTLNRDKCSLMDIIVLFVWGTDNTDLFIGPMVPLFVGKSLSLQSCVFGGGQRDSGAHFNLYWSHGPHLTKIHAPKNLLKSVGLIIVILPCLRNKYSVLVQSLLRQNIWYVMLSQYKFDAIFFSLFNILNNFILWVFGKTILTQDPVCNLFDVLPVSGMLVCVQEKWVVVSVFFYRCKILGILVESAVFEEHLVSLKFVFINFSDIIHEPTVLKASTICNTWLIFINLCMFLQRFGPFTTMFSFFFFTLCHIIHDNNLQHLIIFL